MNFKSALIKLNWFSQTQLGLDLIKLIGFPVHLYIYLKDLYHFKKLDNKIPFDVMPCFHDRKMIAGNVYNEYFWQDIFVARKIYQQQPRYHLDVGSRFDGFISSISIFTKVKVIDIRPLDIKIENVSFLQLDITKDKLDFDQISNEKFESISCLHSIEHFGLGRYGDPISLDSYKIALNNLSKLLSTSGFLYLTFPAGDDKILFNAHRVFNPRKLIDEALSFNLKLHSTYYLDVYSGFKCISDIDNVNLESESTLFLCIFSKSC